MLADDFLARFLEPYLCGGAVRVGLPLERTELEAVLGLADSRPEGLRRLEASVERRAAVLSPRANVLLGRDALTLLAAIYQSLVPFHAAAERGRLSATRLRELERDTARLLAWLEPPSTRSVLLLRHVLLERFFRLYRRDVVVHFSASSVRFYGEDPRWFRWPWRRHAVSEEERGCDPAAELHERAAVLAARALLEASPLTRWLEAERLFGHFALADSESVLADTELCRLVTHHYLDRGVAHAMPALAHAAKSAGARIATARGLSAFLLNLALSEAFWSPKRDPAGLLDPRYRPPTAALRFPEPPLAEGLRGKDQSDATQRPAYARLGWAMVAVLLDADLGLPLDDRNGPSFALLRQWLEQLAPRLPLADSRAWLAS